MPIFNIGIKIVLGLTGIFFAVFFYLCFIWADGHTKAVKAQVATIVSSLYGFLFFCSGALVVLLTSFIVKLWSGIF